MLTAYGGNTENTKETTEKLYIPYVPDETETTTVEETTSFELPTKPVEESLNESAEISLEESGESETTKVADNSNKEQSTTQQQTTTQEQTTTRANYDDVSYEVEEELGKIAGNWGTYDGDTIMQFVPARGNEARIETLSKGIYYKGTYTTDDKTYIKIDYVNVYDESITGTMTLTVVSLEETTTYFGETILQLQLKDEEGTEYLMRPCN